MYNQQLLPQLLSPQQQYHQQQYYQQQYRQQQYNQQQYHQQQYSLQQYCTQQLQQRLHQLCMTAALAFVSFNQYICIKKNPDTYIPIPC